MSANLLILDDQNFEAEVLSTSGIVVCDFWAEWCGPCRALAPVVEQVAAEYAGRVKFGKLDVDGNPRTPAAFNVRSIPTLLFFRDGKMAASLVGAVPKSQIAAQIDALLD